jgi:hypothetical protein
MTEMLRTMCMPGVPSGTMIMLALRWGDSFSGLVSAMTIANSAPSAEEVYHLWPLIT